LVGEGRSLFVNRQIRLEREDLLSLLDELRSAYGTELAEARMLAAEEGDPLAEARRERELILRAAHERAELETAPSRIERIAARRANELLYRARKQAFE